MHRLQDHLFDVRAKIEANGKESPHMQEDIKQKFGFPETEEILENDEMA
jgi:hypothetical protein